MSPSILFFLWTYRRNHKGLSPLYCRITINGKRYQFSVGYFLAKSNWNQTKQKVIGLSISNSYNSNLSSLKYKVLTTYLNSDIEIDCPRKLYDISFGVKEEKSLISVFNEFIEWKSSLGSHKVSPATIRIYRNTKREVELALKKFKIENLEIDDVEPCLVDKIYNSGLDRGLQISTLTKRIKILKQVISFAVQKDYARSNRLISVKLEYSKPKLEYLNKAELKLIEDYKAQKINTIQLKDCFLFSCYTGLGYNEAHSMKFSDIEIDSFGKSWILVNRKKRRKVILFLFYLKLKLLSVSIKI